MSTTSRVPATAAEVLGQRGRHTGAAQMLLELRFWQCLEGPRGKQHWPTVPATAAESRAAA
jgi:hypothetical protein